MDKKKNYRWWTNTISCTLQIITYCEQGGDKISIDSDKPWRSVKGFVQGNNTKKPYPSSDSKPKGIRNITHSYFFGPMQTTSLSRYVYNASFIDDYSRKTWIYFLKKKDEVFEKFKEFKALVENLSKKRIKTLRSNNGGEFTSNEFNDYCKEAGI